MSLRLPGSHAPSLAPRARRGSRSTSLPLPSRCPAPSSSSSARPTSVDTPSSILDRRTALVDLPLHLRQLWRTLPHTHAAGSGIALLRSGAPGTPDAAEEAAAESGRQERTSNACGWGEGGGGGAAANEWRCSGGEGRCDSGRDGVGAGDGAGGVGGALGETSGGRAREKKPKPGARKSRTGGTPPPCAVAAEVVAAVE